jgi:hypothetical protein
MSQPLPAKELTAFKSLLVRGTQFFINFHRESRFLLPHGNSLTLWSLQKLLDQKQYKKALKSIEGILKKCPDHGGTRTAAKLRCRQMRQF